MTTAGPDRARQPAVFIPHGGGPCFFMEWDPPGTWDKMAAWLKDFGAAISAGRPRALLVISSHWEEDEFTVQTNPHPALIYDYSGFPPETYQIKFPAPGDPQVAQEVQDALKAAGIPCRADATRGYDHGVFIPLKVAFPKADIPIVQLSLKKGLNPAEHLAAGRALAGLRDKGVAIIGSGMSYHNMRDFFSGGDALGPSKAFDDWLTAAATNPDAAARDAALAGWTQAPDARRAHPREEHLISLLVVAGAAGADTGRHALSDTVMGTVVSAYSYGL